MERLNDNAQWIVLMGFLVSFSLFFLAVVLNQSIVVGQSTAEGVLEFPKNDIRDFRHEALDVAKAGLKDDTAIRSDIVNLSLSRKNAVVNYTIQPSPIENFNYQTFLHYSNGVSTYNETTYS